MRQTFRKTKTGKRKTASKKKNNKRKRTIKNKTTKRTYKRNKKIMKGGGTDEVIYQYRYFSSDELDRIRQTYRRQLDNFNDKVQKHLILFKKEPSKSIFRFRKRKERNEAKETDLKRLENKVNTALEKYMEQDEIKIPKEELDEIEDDYKKLKKEIELMDDSITYFVIHLNNLMSGLKRHEAIDYREEMNMYQNSRYNDKVKFEHYGLNIYNYSVIKLFRLEKRMENLNNNINKLYGIKVDTDGQITF